MTNLLRLLITDVGATQHSGLDRGQDLQLRADGGNALAHLGQDKTSESSNINLNQSLANRFKLLMQQ